MYRYKLSDHIDNKKHKSRSIKKIIFSKKDWYNSREKVDLGALNHLIIEEKDIKPTIKKKVKEELKDNA